MRRRCSAGEMTDGVPDFEGLLRKAEIRLGDLSSI